MSFPEKELKEWELVNEPRSGSGLRSQKVNKKTLLEKDKEGNEGEHNRYRVKGPIGEKVK